ncbi:MAG: hypothetical protein JXL67_09500 [Calditrichaeota bacterium]|nr:hypothetical protein [Calditrichota bacterium]
MFIIALISGLVINELHPRGISWRLLFIPLFSQSSSEKHEYTVTSVDSAFVLWQRKEIFLVDIRSESDYLFDHIPGAVHISLKELKAGRLLKIAQPSEREKLLIYDGEGNMGNLNLAARILSNQDFPEIYLLFGGYMAWIQRGYPIEGGDM